MSQNWLVVGICGVTCGGKTTLAAELNKILPNSKVISQDDYFLDVDDPRQVIIPELDHLNFELMTSMDMEQMYADILEILKYRTNIPTKAATKTQLFNKSSIDLQKLAHDKVIETNTNVLIIEGFSIFNYKPIEKICDLKYYLTLNEKECKERREKRVYEPPDCPGYFDLCVWPEYLKLFKEVQEDVKHVKYFNEHATQRSKDVLLDIVEVLNS